MPKSVAPFWSEDFSNGIPSTWINSSVPWEYRGPSTTPNVTVGSRGAYASGQAPIESPSAQNGFMIFDSDYYDNYGVAGGFGTGPYPSNPSGHVGTLTTESIDLSNYSAVSLVFNSYYREYTGIAKVAFSTDGGVTFADEMEVHPDIDVNDATTADYEVMLNLPPNVAGQPSVHIQFFYDGTVLYNSYYGYYFWMIDDIRLIETPANLFVCQDEMFGGWWKGYQTTGDLGCNYTFNPMAQALGNPYRLEGVVRNLGANAQNNVTLHGEIADELGNNLFSDVSNPITLAVAAVDTLFGIVIQAIGNDGGVGNLDGVVRTTLDGPDPAWNKALNVISTTATSVTLNVGASASQDQYPHTFIAAAAGALVSGGAYAHTFVSASADAVNVVNGSPLTPINATYDAASGDLNLYFGTAHGVTTSDQLSLDNNSLTFSCDMGRDSTTKTYPRAGSDPVAGQNVNPTAVTATSITINVGASPLVEHNVSNAVYDPATGSIALTIGAHTLSSGTSVKLKE